MYIIYLFALFFFLFSANGEGYLLKTSIHNGKERILDGEDCLPEDPKQTCSKAGIVVIIKVI